MTLFQKIDLVLKNRHMQLAYTRWLWAKLTTGRPPLLDIGFNAKIGRWIKFSEFWSFQEQLADRERRFVTNCIKTRDNSDIIAFDVGANIGLFTCLLAAAGVNRIHAFEPVPETFCRLKANVLDNGVLDRCELNCLAVGKQAELVTFQVEANSPATNKLAPNGGGISNSSIRSLQHIAATSLDAYCSTFQIDCIDFLKVDVEGMEPLVLAGARRMFAEKRIKSVLIEICPGNLRAVGMSPADLYREIEIVRYSPYALNDDGTPGLKLPLAEIQAMTLANIVLLPDA
jgi:FkbM family methyltransferase